MVIRKINTVPLNAQITECLKTDITGRTLQEKLIFLKNRSDRKWM